MAEIVFNFEQYDGQLAKACMKRLRKAAELIRDTMKEKVPVGKESYTYTRKNGRTHTVSGNRPANGKYWTERTPGAMRDTIRLSEKFGEQGIDGIDVRVIAGNKKTWWATQMEYGRGGWKGGRQSFFRPALRQTKDEVQRILENG